eukprot:gene6130-5980_t
MRAAPPCITKPELFKRPSASPNREKMPPPQEVETWNKLPVHVVLVTDPPVFVAPASACTRGFVPATGKPVRFDNSENKVYKVAALKVTEEE